MVAVWLISMLSSLNCVRYAPDLNDSEIEEIGQEPFLIYALDDVANFTVVTKEVSAPSKQRANRRVPDV